MFIFFLRSTERIVKVFQIVQKYHQKMENFVEIVHYNKTFNIYLSFLDIFFIVFFR